MVLCAIASRSSGRPGVGRVVVVPGVAARGHGRLDDVLRGREVGLARAEADHVLARRLQRLGLGVDGERRRLVDGGDAGGDAFHASMVARAGRGRNPKIRQSARLAWSARWPAVDRSRARSRSPRCSSVLLAPTAAGAPAARAAAAPQSPPPKAFVVVDAKTGAVLASRQPARRAPAGEHREDHDRARRGRAPAAGRADHVEPARRGRSPRAASTCSPASNGRSTKRWRR